MEKKTAGLVGALASLASMGAAQAAMPQGHMVAEVLRVSSYADLLNPIPNATEILKASNAEMARRAQTRPPI